MQAPNRENPWSRSQQPRDRAMSGPRFEQTIMEYQVSMLHENNSPCTRTTEFGPGVETWKLTLDVASTRSSHKSDTPTTSTLDEGTKGRL